MRGGLERWKRGQASQGVRQAIAYAIDGACDSPVPEAGVHAVAGYAEGTADRFVVVDGLVARDRLSVDQLTRWVDGREPISGERRGRDLTSPDADLVLDGTINAPKSFSIAALMHPELAVEFEALQERLRDRILLIWQRELNARRGAGGRVRESLSRIEVVELKHRRSRALDPHVHRHLWLNVKVQGRDGRWSNVDSRVAMRLHTLINAEGELLARTDPAWRAALAGFGYSIDAGGEIAELAHMVRPLSRRSAQIDANRAVKLAQWRADHPRQQPGPIVMRSIDRWAWAHARPDKPAPFAEDEWEAMIRDELTTLGSPRLRGKVPRSPRLGSLDRKLLAAIAVTEADRRAASTGGRFSRIDVRAGATRAVAATGVIADRAILEELIDDVTARGLRATVDLLDGERDAPSHIKRYLSATTAALKTDLADRYAELSGPGEAFPAAQLAALAGDLRLDDGQSEAAAAIAGTDRLVTITGPAGTGKTTMLRVAQAAITSQGRKMVVVAPTRKAAAVASREVGAAAGSLHALLVDHGWRFAPDAAGRVIWTQLRRGQRDPVTGAVYSGPRRYPLRARDRVVVDEAGMVDLDAARALAIVAEQTGVGIAMLGDALQARPVGHSGAMGIIQRRSNRVVELTDVHRFNDQGYASLTLRLRNPGSEPDALAVAAALVDRGLVRRVQDGHEAREYMVDRYFHAAVRGQRVALVVGSNAEADVINEAIQRRRLERGELDPRHVAAGRDGQPLHVGDVVQTRRNDRQIGVDNRAIWVITALTADGVQLGSVTDPGDVRVVSRAYCATDVHLSYASTVHGIQGETTHASVVGPDVDAAGLYVGMTRGRARNEVVTIARDDAEAAVRVAAIMTRGMPELSLGESIREARRELGRAARDSVAPPEHHVRAGSLPHGGRDGRAGVVVRARQTARSLAARIAHLDARTHSPNQVDQGRERIAELRHQHEQLQAVIRQADSRPVPLLGEAPALAAPPQGMPASGHPRGPGVDATTPPPAPSRSAGRSL